MKMAKRAGTYLTVDEVLAKIPPAVFRFMMLSTSPNQHLDFDFQLAQKQGKENPLYYVFYAGVRAGSVLEKAEGEQGQPVRPREREERDLVLDLISFPDLMEEVREELAPHKIINWLGKLAGDFHNFYERLPILKAEKERKGRLFLCQATRQLIEEGLAILGIKLPRRM